MVYLSIEFIISKVENKNKMKAGGKNLNLKEWRKKRIENLHKQKAQNKKTKVNVIIISEII